MKRVYFVRHGESEANAGVNRSSPESPLTQRGQRQAAFIAERISKLPIEALISSTMVRAEQTAESISKRIGINAIFSNLFVEARASSEVTGKPRDSEEVLQITKLFFKNFGKPEWRYSDEENFEDLKERAKKALNFLEAKTEEHILIVTHGFFMRVLVAVAIFGDTLTARECQQFIRTFHMENTGLTILGYDEKNTLPWWLWVWNDHAHLG